MENLIPGDLRDLRELADQQEFWLRRVLLQLVDSYEKWAGEVDELESKVVDLEGELMDRDARIEALSNEIEDLKVKEVEGDKHTRGNQGTGKRPRGPKV